MEDLPEQEDKRSALLHFRNPPFFIDDSGAEFHAD